MKKIPPAVLWYGLTFFAFACFCVLTQTAGEQIQDTLFLIIAFVLSPTLSLVCSAKLAYSHISNSFLYPITVSCLTLAYFALAGGLAAVNLQVLVSGPVPAVIGTALGAYARRSLAARADNA